MVYRDFGTLDRPVSLLGFGCMRLPTEPTPTAISGLSRPRPTVCFGRR